MTKAHAVALINEIQMRVNLQNVEIPLIVKRIDARDID